MTRTLIIIAPLASSVVHAQTYKDVRIDVRKPWRSNAAAIQPARAGR